MGEDQGQAVQYDFRNVEHQRRIGRIHIALADGVFLRPLRQLRICLVAGPRAESGLDLLYLESGASKGKGRGGPGRKAY